MPGTLSTGHEPPRPLAPSRAGITAVAHEQPAAAHDIEAEDKTVEVPASDTEKTAEMPAKGSKAG